MNKTSDTTGNSSDSKEDTKMSDRESDTENDELIDPPENQGGGGEGMNMDSPAEEAAAKIDPPSNDGGN
jgi:hypothetical protein